ncbi:MAG: hypothetical protein A3J81_00230 [Nitrospirae bacterium RIFOXYB2_FULL_43_5]|nr:MAG: hypothetical protein A3J81_00230 [Nitrospirae bacterium RIFOXYB2_FULL_43_5]
MPRSARLPSGKSSSPGIKTLFASPAMTWLILPSLVIRSPICFPISDESSVRCLASSGVITLSAGTFLR